MLESTLVATVVRREWLVLNLLIPANLHIVDTVVDSLFHPIGTQENQQSSFGFFNGVKWNALSGLSDGQGVPQPDHGVT